MAAVTTIANGTWSSGSTVFSGGSGVGGVPDATDTVTITHDIEVDTTSAVCDTLTINAGGTLRPSTTTNSKLVVDKTIDVANSATATLSYDMSSAPAYTAELRWNNDNNATADNTNRATISGQATLKGADKKYYTFAEGSLTKDSSAQCYVDDATGWLAGDMLCFADTQAAAATQPTITNVTYNAPGAYLEITAASHGLEVGDQVQFFNLQTGLNQVKYVVSVVVSSSVFRVPSGSVTVTDTSGFMQRQARAEIVTIATITFDNAPTNTGRALVTWTDGLGTTGTLCHDHADNCVVANLTRNVVLAPGVSMGKLILTAANSTYTRPISNVLFKEFNGSSSFPACTLGFTGGKFSEITNCVFYNWTGVIQGSSNAGGGDFTRTRNTYYNEYNGGLYSYSNLSGLISTESDMLVLRGGLNSMVALNWVLGYLENPLISGVVGVNSTAANSAFTANVPPPTGRASIEGGAFWSCLNVVTSGQGSVGITPITLSNTRLGIGPTGASYSAQNAYLASGAGTAPITLDTCPLYSTSEAPRALGTGGEFIFINKDEDPGVQEVYTTASYTIPVISRVTDTKSNSTSALMMQWTGTANTQYARDLPVSIAAGKTETILIAVRKNSSYGASTLPKAVVYDGTTVVTTYTMDSGTAADTWETLTVQITNSNSSDKQYRIRLAGQSAVNGAKCWFSGVPIAPFITKVRWYGYEFIETSAVRKIDITKSVSEATAAAYNTVNMTFSWSTTAGSSTTSIIADTTFQQLFDGHQAQAVLNVDKAIAIHGAGVAGSPSIFADGNVTISTTKKLNGSGSIAMAGETATSGTTIVISADATNDKFTRASGDFTTDFAVGSFVTTSGFANAANNGTFVITALDATNMTVDAALTTETGSGDEEIVELTKLAAEFTDAAFTGTDAYTYSGGTWSQADDIPTFSGGVLKIGAAGAYPFVQAASMTLVVEPTGASTYDLGDAIFTGTLTVHNITAHAITVQVPTGTTTSSAGNSGGAITFSAPVITADISITGMPNDAVGTTRLQIRNTTAEAAAAWQAGHVYATGAIVKRVAGLGTENTLGLYFRAITGGTSGGVEPTWVTTTPGVSTTTDNTVTWLCCAVLYYDADPGATSLTDTYIDGEEFLAGETVDIRFAEMNGASTFKTYDTTVITTSAGFSALVSEEAEPVFATYAIDGSTQDGIFSPNYTSSRVVMDANIDFSGKGAFAYYCYVLTTSEGMARFWGGVTAVDAGNIRINTSILNLYFDESAGFVKQTDDVRIYRDDGTRPAIDPTTGGHGIEINWRTPVSVIETGVSGVTAQDIADIATAAASAVVADSATLTVPLFMGLK